MVEFCWFVVAGDGGCIGFVVVVVVTVDGKDLGYGCWGYTCNCYW